MNKRLQIAAQALSTVLYPLFIPTFGMALFCYAYHSHVYPLAPVWVLVALVGTFVLTCLLPVSAIWLLIRQGRVADMQITNASERTIPYLYALTGFAFWSYFVIHILRAPVYIGFIAVGAMTALAFVLLINRRWKISAHLTGFGGLFGGVMSYCLGTSSNPGWSILSVWSVLTIALMWSRLYLNAHTSAQVIAGWLLGISFTFLPYAIYTYAI